MVDRSSPDIESLIHKLNRAWRFEYQDPDACGGFIEKITPAEYKSIVDGLGALSAGFAQTAQQWMDIETAPKDGTIILICGNGSGGYYVADVKWDGDWLLFDVSSDDWTEPTFAVSHWMPLPEPPALSVSSTTREGK